MKTMKPFCLALLVLTGSLPGARGDDFRTDINPALLYYRAFLLAPDPLSEVDGNYLDSKKGMEQKLPERFGPIVAGYDNQFLLVCQAAHAKVPCDWGVDTSPGPNTMLPHLARAKAVARAAQLRAVWALQHGQPDDAREDLLAAFVLGRNTASDRFLIGALVEDAIEGINYVTVAQHFGEFPPETLKQLVDGFEAAPALATMAECAPMEKLGFYDWQVRKILELQKAHPNDDAKVMAGYRECGVVEVMKTVGHTNFWPRLMAASGGSSEGILKLLREEEPLFPRIFKIMALPEPAYEIQARQLLDEIRDSQNPFLNAINLYFTGFTFYGGAKLQVRPKEFSVQAQLAMLHAAVEYRLHGEAGFEGVLDPFGNGPFRFQRFMFKGVDRGFEVRSAYAGTDAPFVMIFVEKPGAAFHVSGPDVGKAITQ